MSSLPPIDAPTGGTYTPVEPTAGTSVNALKVLQLQVQEAYVQARIDTDTNNRIVALLAELAPLLKMAGIAAL
jgi:hypothetical protein